MSQMVVGAEHPEPTKDASFTIAQNSSAIQCHLVGHNVPGWLGREGSDSMVLEVCIPSIKGTGEEISKGVSRTRQGQNLQGILAREDWARLHSW